jgi:2,3-bisphosphoglycerate-dependent phosphoglycerate mutase
MGVGIRVGSITDEIGSPSFLHSFFSTISAHCDKSGWGSWYPNLFELYQGHLPSKRAALALEELRGAKAVLSELPPSAVVWDIEDRSAKPPWGGNISAHISSLGNYFVSSTGRDLFSLLEEALQASADEGNDAYIE